MVHSIRFSNTCSVNGVPAVMEALLFLCKIITEVESELLNDTEI